jgi:hypothetical protein
MSKIRIRSNPRDLERFRSSYADLQKQHPELKEHGAMALAAQNVWGRGRSIKITSQEGNPVGLRGGSVWTPPPQKDYWADRGVLDVGPTAERKWKEKRGGVPKPIRKMPGQGCSCGQKASGGGSDACSCKYGQEGEGVLGDLAEKAGKLVTKVAAWIAPSGMPKKVKKMLEELRGYTISSMTVCRVPIIGVIEKLLRAVAKTQPSYDKLYHLYLVCNLKGPNGESKKVRIERNQTFEMTWAKSSDEEVTTVDVPDGVTGSACARVKLPSSSILLTTAMDSFIKEAEKRNPQLGAWRYAALANGDIPENNCQSAVTSFLKGIGALTSSLSTFINQKVENLLSPKWLAGAQAVTDLAGAAGNALFGGRKHHVRGLEDEMLV